jgi:hypothetical protein
VVCFERISERRRLECCQNILTAPAVSSSSSLQTLQFESSEPYVSCFSIRFTRFLSVLSSSAPPVALVLFSAGFFSPCWWCMLVVLFVNSVLAGRVSLPLYFSAGFCASSFCYHVFRSLLFDSLFSAPQYLRVVAVFTVCSRC